MREAPGSRRRRRLAGDLLPAVLTVLLILLARWSSTGEKSGPAE